MQNDGSEAAELHHSNLFDISQLRVKLASLLRHTRLLRQKNNDSFVLLQECRDLLEVTALESPLRRDILKLIAKIDGFLPQAIAKGD